MVSHGTNVRCRPRAEPIDSYGDYGENSGHMAREASLHIPYPKYICGTTVSCILLACSKQLIGRANC
ncbi:hypothetical protein TNCV_2094521 [Trichonephila clavipes]|nr:hypothetical protein TNCV_2094521 [Trichonephila clavipes]